MKLLQKSSCIVVIGSSGSEKSSVVHKTALRLQDQGYVIYIVNEPAQIFENHQQQTHKVFVLDDPFGKGTICREEIIKWERHLDKLKHILQIEENDNLSKTKIREQVKISENMLLGKTLILISCSLNIYRNHFVAKISKALMFQECNLSSVDMC